MSEFFKCYELSNEHIDTDITRLGDFIRDNTKETVQSLQKAKSWLLKPSVNMSLIEKYVYDIAIFQFKELGIAYDSNKHYIEFWYRTKKNLNDFHIDVDDEEMCISGDIVTPLLSIVFYIDESIYPTILTNIDHNKYKRSNYKGENSFSLSFPKKRKVVSFNSSYMHTACNILVGKDNKQYQRPTIMINLWNIKPYNINYFDSNYFKNIIPSSNSFTSFKKITNSIKLYTQVNMQNQIFFNKLVNNKTNDLYVIGDILSNMYGNNLLQMGIEDSIVECYVNTKATG
jgi:hypothetical protein